MTKLVPPARRYHIARESRFVGAGIRISEHWLHWRGRQVLSQTTYVVEYLSETRKASCRWQTREMLAKRLHGLCKSCVASLPIDSLPRVSYYRPIATLCLKGTVFDIWWHIGWNRRKNLPHPHWHVPLGWPLANFSTTHTLPETRIMGAIRRCTFHDPAFALLGTIPVCDRQTDRHAAVAKTALA